ncbi:hypothetical protein EHYA_01762 [Embleya hyalina]|uniref:Uncharacterized protein n=1 Tax=Embleya hyalina TaxID=516124 RepID=A0A401YHL3_9ACTN|nr:hypothetical protein EHYA_01762 [Embleya hyalina]
MPAAVAVPVVPLWQSAGGTPLAVRSSAAVCRCGAGGPRRGVGRHRRAGSETPGVRQGGRIARRKPTGSGGQGGRSSQVRRAAFPNGSGVPGARCAVGSGWPVRGWSESVVGRRRRAGLQDSKLPTRRARWSAKTGCRRRQGEGPGRARRRAFPSGPGAPGGRCAGGCGPAGAGSAGVGDGPPPACGATRPGTPDEAGALIGEKRPAAAGREGARVESAGEPRGYRGAMGACGGGSSRNRTVWGAAVSVCEKTAGQWEGKPFRVPRDPVSAPTGHFRSPQRPLRGRSARSRPRPGSFGLRAGVEEIGAHETGTRRPTFHPDPAKPQVTETRSPQPSTAIRFRAPTPLQTHPKHPDPLEKATRRTRPDRPPAPSLQAAFRRARRPSRRESRVS